MVNAAEEAYPRDLTGQQRVFIDGTLFPKHTYPVTKESIRAELDALANMFDDLLIAMGLLTEQMAIFKPDEDSVHDPAREEDFLAARRRRFVNLGEKRPHLFPSTPDFIDRAIELHRFRLRDSVDMQRIALVTRTLPLAEVEPIIDEI